MQFAKLDDSPMFRKQETKWFPSCDSLFSCNSSGPAVSVHRFMVCTSATRSEGSSGIWK
ncbi:unnamed protein product [Sphenostylis stenocarpa]|uniref:Uncharacterized protein n=1 Tax=Sphenostylis stenocarpa TaxID=92480 RepID=A0AA86V1V3_9FABA|nr:unnamed protein product [Sphenostylis stenocarpa]